MKDSETVGNRDLIAYLNEVNECYTRTCLSDQQRRYEKVLLSIAGQEAFSAWCDDGAPSIVPYEEYVLDYINDLLKEQGLPTIETN